MKKHLMIMGLLASIFLLPACIKRSSVKGVEPVPSMKTYSASLDKVKLAVADALVKLDIIYQTDDTLGKIETEWFETQKIPGWESTFTDLNYKAKEFIIVRKAAEDTSVRFQARFRQQAVFSSATEDEEFPEAENFLRKRFFEDLDAALASSSQPAAPTPAETPPPPVTSDVERKKIMVNRGNIRSRPSTNSHVIGKAYYGQEVEIRSRHGQWSEIVTPSGQKGWVNEVLFKPQSARNKTMASATKEKSVTAPPETESEASSTTVLDPALKEDRIEQVEGRQPSLSGAPFAEDVPGSGSAGSAKADKPAQIIITDLQPEQTIPNKTDAKLGDTGVQEPGRPQAAPSAAQTPTHIRISDRGSAAILEAPSPVAPIIATVPAGTKLAALGKEDNYYLVQYQSKKGYVYKTSCEAPTKEAASQQQVQSSDVSTRPPVIYLRTSDKGPAGLLEEPNAFARVIASIPPGTRVECSKKEGSFYQVHYQGKTGYLYKASCEEVE